MEKLHGKTFLSQFRTWRNRGGDFCELNQLTTYPVNEQMADLRMVLYPATQKLVKVAFGILQTSVTSPADVIDQISIDIYTKRNIVLGLG